MRSLYDINKDFLSVIENGFAFDEETGEITFDESNLTDLEMEFKDKADNVASYIKNRIALIESIKAEKKALDERLKQEDKRVSRLKDYLSEALKMRDMKDLETGRNKISFRKSVSVNVTDESKIADNYFTEKVERKLDKKSLLADLKKGEVVEGAELQENSNLQLK